MNANKNGQSRLDEYEVSAIYDDAGTPPRAEWLKQKQRRERRQQQLRRFDDWLIRFRRARPFGYVLFCLGCGLVFGTVVLGVLDFLDWLSTVVRP